MALITAISDAAKDELDRMDAAAQKHGLGTELKELQTNIATVETGALYVLETIITADATGEVAIPVTFPCKVVDVIVECTAANANGTLTLKKGGTAITDAIICAVDKVVTRAGTIDDAQSTLAVSDTALTVDAAQAGDRGRISVLVRRTA